MDIRYWEKFELLLVTFNKKCQKKKQFKKLPMSHYKNIVKLVHKINTYAVNKATLIIPLRTPVIIAPVRKVKQKQHRLSTRPEY